MRKEREYTCLECSNKFWSREKRCKFCSKSCSAKYNGKRRISPTPEHREKTSNSLKRKWANSPRYQERSEKIKSVGFKSQKNKHKKPTSILELSKRTVAKICKRLNLRCSRCGWDEDTCDIHHIIPKKKGGDDKHTNLVCLCPNCHRLAGNGKIPITEFITLDIQIGDSWLQFYYG